MTSSRSSARDKMITSRSWPSLRGPSPTTSEDQLRGPCQRRPSNGRWRGSLRRLRCRVDSLIGETPPLNRNTNNRCGQAAKLAVWAPGKGRYRAICPRLSTRALWLLCARIKTCAVRKPAAASRRISRGSASHHSAASVPLFPRSNYLAIAR